MKRVMVEIIAGFLFASAFTACSFLVTSRDIQSISVEELKQKIAQGQQFVILDVRNLDEFHGELGNIEGAILIPLPELEDRYSELQPFRDKEIVVYCRSGNRSKSATIFLNKKGFKALNLSGGIIAWNDLAD